MLWRASHKWKYVALWKPRHYFCSLTSCLDFLNLLSTAEQVLLYSYPAWLLFPWLWFVLITGVLPTLSVRFPWAAQLLWYTEERRSIYSTSCTTVNWLLYWAEFLTFYVTCYLTPDSLKNNSFESQHENFGQLLVWKYFLAGKHRLYHPIVTFLQWSVGYHRVPNCCVWSESVAASSSVPLVVFCFLRWISAGSCLCSYEGSLSLWGSSVPPCVLGWADLRCCPLLLAATAACLEQWVRHWPVPGLPTVSPSPRHLFSLPSKRRRGDVCSYLHGCPLDCPPGANFRIVFPPRLYGWNCRSCTVRTVGSIFLFEWCEIFIDAVYALEKQEVLNGSLRWMVESSLSLKGC